MLSYKEYKELNENFGLPIPLGIKPKQSFSNYQSKWDEMGMSMPIKMSKKKSKKFMLNQDMPSQLPGDHEFDGDEEEDMSPPMDLKKPMLKKKTKKTFDFDDRGDEEETDTEEDFDDEEGDEEEDFGDDEDDEGDDEDFDDEEEVETDDEEDFGDEEEEEEDFIKKKKPMGDKDMLMKKKPMKAPMPQMPNDMGGNDMMTPKMMGKGCMGKGCTCGSKKCPVCKKKQKKMNYMKKEQTAFLRKLQNQTGYTYFPINSDGTFKEDVIFPPEDINAGLDPRPGESGFAPQGRIGSMPSYAPDNFQEWVKTKTKRRR